MKTTLVIPSIPEYELPPDACAALAGVYPQGQTYNSRGDECWSLRLPDTDPRVPQILDILAGHNLRLWHGLSNPTSSDIVARYEREYSKKDLADATHLSPFFRNTFGADRGRNADGEMRKAGDEMNPKAAIGGSWGGSVFVSIDLKEKIEDQDFLGAKFLPIELVGRHTKAVEGRYRELTSTITLPPMSPHMTFFNAVRGETRQEVDRDFPEPSILREGRDAPHILYEIPELHYNAADIAEPFDIALTYERFGQNRPHTVFSQRFYQFCLRNKLPIGWIPVHIDEG